MRLSSKAISYDELFSDVIDPVMRNHRDRFKGKKTKPSYNDIAMVFPDEIDPSFMNRKITGHHITTLSALPSIMKQGLDPMMSRHPMMYRKGSKLVRYIGNGTGIIFDKQEAIRTSEAPRFQSRKPIVLLTVSSIPLSWFVEFSPHDGLVGRVIRPSMIKKVERL